MHRVSLALVHAMFFLLLAVPIPLSRSTATDTDVDDMIGVNTEYAKSILNQTSRYLTAVNEKWLWPHGVLPYVFTGNFSLKCRNMIAKTMSTIESVSCIRFVVFDPNEHAEKFETEKVKGACQSTVGRLTDQKGKHHLDLDEHSCHQGIIIHELFHTLGFDHEHTPLDRDRSK